MIVVTMRTLSDLSGNRSNCYRITDPINDLTTCLFADEEEGAKDLFIIFVIGAPSPSSSWDRSTKKIRDGLIVEKGSWESFAEKEADKK